MKTRKQRKTLLKTFSSPGEENPNITEIDDDGQEIVHKISNELS